MAKRGSAIQRATKLKNNKVGILQCSVVGCDCEFFTKHPDKPRMCSYHAALARSNPPQRKKVERSLLYKLGLIS